MQETKKNINFFKTNGWNAIASPARPTERSPAGTTDGVAVAISNHVENRPPLFSHNPEGTLTHNAQLTGRLTRLDKIEVLMLAGYLECGLGFAGANHEFIIELEFVTRGGGDHFSS